VNRISFGTIITLAKSGMLASHVPMLIERSGENLGTLFGHIARGNIQWRETLPAGQGLAVFLGPDAYISPNWYYSQKEGGRVVPTWNYVAIHVRGPVTFFEDTEKIREIVTRLTKHHEAYSKNPWEVTDAPEDYISGELRQIVGFEMPIVKIEGKWKLSQNRPEEDRKSVMKNLQERDNFGDKAVSREMKSRESKPDLR